MSKVYFTIVETLEQFSTEPCQQRYPISTSGFETSTAPLDGRQSGKIRQQVLDATSQVYSHIWATGKSRSNLLEFSTPVAPSLANILNSSFLTPLVFLPPDRFYSRPSPSLVVTIPPRAVRLHLLCSSCEQACESHSLQFKQFSCSWLVFLSRLNAVGQLSFSSWSCQHFLSYLIPFILPPRRMNPQISRLVRLAMANRHGSPS